ncbi:ATP-binding protein [Microbacterium sp. NPDC076911]|uniref:sensor histidine kinase n=1 Tax=Microbacterium sp. NPDC076911 TaxID=3154958 RepID=UPI0034135576
MTEPQRLESRTNSIWLSQLLLAVVVVVIVLLVQAIEPETMQKWTFSVGVSAMVIITALALIVPWSLLPSWAALSIPFLDIIAVGTMSAQTTIDLAYLWAFPVIWIASHYGAIAITSSLVTIAVIVAMSELSSPGSAPAALRVSIVTLTLTFIAISTRHASQQTRAFKRLLVREASKLNEALAQARRQEHNASQMIETIDVGIARISASGEVDEFNDTYRSLYGIRASDLTAPPSSVEYDALRGAPVPAGNRPLQRAMRGEQFDDARTWLFTATGVWHALSLTARSVPSDDGSNAPNGALLIAHDITAMLRAENLRQTLTARISHELRNPLTTVLGFSELLLDDEELPARAHKQVNEISMAGQRMLTLSEAILQSGATAQKDELVMVPTDLSKVITQSVDSFEPMAGSKSVAVEWYPSATTFVMGDAFRLRQLVDNLLSNAIKYTPKGGKVMLYVTATDDEVSLSISDTGSGMTAEEVEHIYDPYYRAPGAVTSEVQGTGLGMGIVKSLIEQHNGTLEIESAPMRGTTMTATLTPAPADVEAGAQHA